MKVLLVSNGYPSAEYPFGSIYVKNHYERLKREKVIDIVDKHVIYRKDTSLIGTIIKYCRCYVLFTKKLFNKYDVLHIHFMSPLYLLLIIFMVFLPNCILIVTFYCCFYNNFIIMYILLI